MPPKPCALSIAGSDSGGGAGIQVDLRVMHRLGVFGTSAITAVTAQNLDGVEAVSGMDPTLVTAQIEAVLTGFKPAAIKTGMLWSAAIIDGVCARLKDYSGAIVVDPVMVATSGARLLAADAVASYQRLFRHATLVTPNLDEAEVLLGRPLERAKLDEDAAILSSKLGCSVLLKGGHLQGDPCDRLVHRNRLWRWQHPRVADANTHGSGCMLSAAIAAYLAQGRELSVACEHALALVHDALRLGAEQVPLRLAAVEAAKANLAALEGSRCPLPGSY
jgi:hydroxymethylpyrimidine kinase/phosphomethylpyrimidine kinase